MKILQITTSWPTSENRVHGHFIYTQTEALMERGVDIYTFSFNGHKNPFNYFIAWLKLRKHLGSSEYDLVLCQFGQSALVSFPSSSPVVVWLHGTDILGIPNEKGKYTLTGKILTAAVQLFCKSADGIIGVSSQVLSKVYNVSCPKVLIPMGVNLSVYHPMPREQAASMLGLSLEYKYVFFPSNPERKVKNYQLAKDSVELLMRDDVKLLVAKNIPPKDMPLYYNVSDVVLVTSFHEGSPNVVKEAMACNRPVVSVKVGDVKERFEGVENCFSVKHDKFEIAEKLKFILSNELQTNAREIVAEIEEDKMLEKTISFLISVIDGKKLKKY